MTSILPILGTLLLQEASRSRPDTGEEWGFLFYFSVSMALMVVIAVAVLAYGSWRDRRQTGVDDAPSATKPSPKLSREKKPVTRTSQRKSGKTAEDVKPEKHASAAIFVSYRREDSSDVTGRIYDRLTQHFGKQSVFKDVDSIPLGVDFKKHLGDSVGKCNVMIAVIGRQWASGEGSERLKDERDFVRVEIEAALQRDIPVVPVLVQGAQIPREEMLPASLRSLSYRNGLSVRPDPDFHQDMDRLIKGIEGHLK